MPYLVLGTVGAVVVVVVRKVDREIDKMGQRLFRSIFGTEGS